MKFIIAIVLLTGVRNLFAQTRTVDSSTYFYAIDLTTNNDNVLKGLLLEVKDSSIWIYPGTRKEWKRHTLYASVEFGYNNIKQVKLKKKNSMLKGIGAGSIQIFHIKGNKSAFNEFQKNML